MATDVLFSNDDYEIRPANNTDEFRDLWWSFMQGLGWNRGYYDLDSYMNPSLGAGMILLIDKSTNKPVGHVSAVINSNSTGWISMFIVDAAHRGKGVGSELFKAGMADFERHGTQIRGLDAVVEQKATYERRGFVESPLGTVKILVRPLVEKQALPPQGHHFAARGSIVDIREVPYELLAQHELKYTGFDRPRLWSEEHMFKRPDVAGFALVRHQKPQSVDDLLAWTVIRRCSGGIRVGPVYAEDHAYARLVLLVAMKAATAEYVKKVPLPNEPMSGLAESEISEKAILVAEAWCGNPGTENLFNGLGWRYADVQYHQMWVDAKATPEFSEGGLAQKGVFAVFDAAIG